MQQSWQENLLELETSLARSTAPWKLVIGHHPVRRNNRPDNNMDMLPTLEPILEKYGVQAYFCGHEHNLQYIHQQNSSVHYVITGGGSLTDYSPIVHYDNGGSHFQYWGSGESFCLVHEYRACVACNFAYIWLCAHNNAVPENRPPCGMYCQVSDSLTICRRVDILSPLRLTI